MTDPRFRFLFTKSTKMSRNKTFSILSKSIFALCFPLAVMDFLQLLVKPSSSLEQANLSEV